MAENRFAKKLKAGDTINRLMIDEFAGVILLDMNARITSMSKKQVRIIPIDSTVTWELEYSAKEFFSFIDYAFCGREDLLDCAKCFAIAYRERRLQKFKLAAGKAEMKLREESDKSQLAYLSEETIEKIKKWLAETTI